MDKFGRVSLSRRIPSAKRSGFPMTSDGDYDFTGHKLCNVDEPIRKSDAANMNYVDLTAKRIMEDLGKLGIVFFQFKGVIETKCTKLGGELENTNNNNVEMYKKLNEQLDYVSKQIHIIEQKLVLLLKDR